MEASQVLDVRDQQYELNEPAQVIPIRREKHLPESTQHGPLTRAQAVYQARISFAEMRLIQRDLDETPREIMVDAATKAASEYLSQLSLGHAVEAETFRTEKEAWMTGELTKAERDQVINAAHVLPSS